MAMFTPATWGWPQYTELALLLLSVGISLAKDGEPNTRKHSFWSSLVAMLIMVAILYCGGFYAPR